MSWFNLKQPMGANYTADPSDIINTKKALNQIGYYDVPPHRGIDDWTDDAMFNGIRAFQKDNNLKVDGFMRPGGPTEGAVNIQLAAGEQGRPVTRPGQSTQPPGTSMQCPTPQGGTRDRDNPWLGTDKDGTVIRCVDKGIFGPYGGSGWEILRPKPR